MIEPRVLARIESSCLIVVVYMGFQPVLVFLQVLRSRTQSRGIFAGEIGIIRDISRTALDKARAQFGIHSHHQAIVLLAEATSKICRRLSIVGRRPIDFSSVRI